MVDLKSKETYFHLATDKRPKEEFYDIVKDPGCLKNLVNDKSVAGQLGKLRKQLKDYQLATKDPRETGDGDYLESFPRLNGEIRSFPKID
ncbi:hypothetical protein [Dyadobacter sandarakinus]|uniref:N-sulphoglucosamine sulphohydrolase C-terminal domain-containing protein n=1 Tax=Dyadobacter sandarakinus TaxID=2747268 RepID=A0ABX7I4X5_9BACT|nr:hypothetical protein [Dyadobacter sandarakinus]QRR00763.1 hypothetical protein HWI92_07510 [Dyadobacter sandarakinus]